jgi:type IV pilus assembly protein PilC
MPIFLYRARDQQGILITGELEAISADDLKLYLAERGLIPLTVRQASAGKEISVLKKLFRKKVKPEEILVTTRQFYTLFKAGMGMEAILATLARQASNPRLKETLQGIRSAVQGGESLSKAFARHPDIFGELYTSMLAAGEEAGILEEVLGNLCGLLEKEMQIKTAVKSATLYPKIVIFVLIVAMAVIMTVVMPKFSSFYAHYKAELPLPTRLLIGFSGFMQHYWYVMGLILGGIVFVYKRYARTARGKLKTGALRLQLPVFGPLNIKVANARFCHILAALYRSGLTMTRCLEITGNTIENGAFAREIQILKGEVTQGKTISDGMLTCRYFTPVIVDATAVGEKTGALDEMLETMGTHYDVEVQHTIKNLTTLLEPFLLFLIFGMVAVFTLAIFLPIWNMSQIVIKR